MFRFNFEAYSVKDLDIDVTVYAHTYIEARHKVLKYIALDKTEQNISFIIINNWGEEK
jgi:hypothetical protein